MGEERHSKPVRTEALPALTDAQKARQEALNTLLQYDRMKELINGSLHSDKPFRLRSHVILDLNRLSIDRIEEDAGRWRDFDIEITGSRHQPPPWKEVPRHVDELCEYINDHWDDRSPLHLAAYVMWRLNWIHPFVDGNGRTTRAVSYYVLCSKLGFYIPGTTTIPELIAHNKNPYYVALESADGADLDDRIDVTEMEELLKLLLARQLMERAESVESIKTESRSRNSRVDSGKQMERPVQQADSFSKKVGVAFAAGTALFLMALVLLSVWGRPVPAVANNLVILLFALCGAMSTGFLRGRASARGSIPIPVGSKKEHTVRFQATEGIAVFILLLFIGKLLLS